MLGIALLYNFGKKVRLLPKLYLLRCAVQVSVQYDGRGADVREAAFGRQ